LASIQRYSRIAQAYVLPLYPALSSKSQESFIAASTGGEYIPRLVEGNSHVLK
jgi:hypothetical protein